MIDITALLRRADEYKRLSGIMQDKTVSYRVFGDSKKLESLRCGADITVRRFNAAIEWFDQNWPLAENPPQPAASAAPTQEHSHENTSDGC